MATPTTIRPMAKRLLKASLAQNTPPTFLLPSLRAPLQQSSSFSTTSSSQYPRDMNRERGVSSQRRTGLRQPLSVSKARLPVPVLDPDLRPQVEVDESHGLWGFFFSKDKPFATPLEYMEHGRAWTVEELRQKSFEDLHALWWVCCKERNKIATDTFERRRVNAGAGDAEAGERDFMVKRTMRGIKHTLTERYYAYRTADMIKEKDPEIDLSGDGPVYKPREFTEEDEEAIEAENKVEKKADKKPARKKGSSGRKKKAA